MGLFERSATAGRLGLGPRTRSCTASERISSQGSLTERRRRELAPCELSLQCYRSSAQVDELVLEVLPPRSRSQRLAALASES